MIGLSRGFRDGRKTRSVFLVAPSQLRVENLFGDHGLRNGT